MTSESCGFKISERGFKETLVLVPGWATDHRIFSSLDLNYNYISPERIDPLNLGDKLLSLLDKKSISKVSLFGWSLGGFLAVEFALKNAGRVDELILLGIRRNFDPVVLDKVKEKVLEDRRAYLSRFYLECFSGGDGKSIAWFKEHLLKDYLEEMSSDGLIAGLDYLSRARIDFESLGSVRKLRVFHGTEDRIAPFKEAEEIKDSLPGLKFISMQGAGHAVFLDRGFKEKFENG